MLKNLLERWFKLKEHNTTFKIEFIAGLTTFMTMAYILVVNPDLMSKTGMNKNAIFTATALAAFVGSFLMATIANLPFGMATGMGANSFFVYSIVFHMGFSWQFALAATLVEGILFIILTAFKIRELIVDIIPKNLKLAISSGIGIFIAFIGLTNAGIVVPGGAILKLGNLFTPGVTIALFTLLLGALLLHYNIRGAILLAIISGTILSILLGVTTFTNFKFISFPPSLAPIFWQFDFSQIISFNFLTCTIALLFMELFDTVGCLISISTQAGLVDNNGRVLRVREALFADAIATTIGAMLGTATVTVYVESAAGVAQGGKTGLVAFVISILFLVSLFFSSFFMLIPTQATAAALIMVGVYMFSSSIDLISDKTEGIPCFLTIVLIPLTFSIANGIFIGIISYVITKTITGQFKKLNWLIVTLAILFIIYFLKMPY